MTHPPLLLRVALVVIIAVPANYVIEPLGAVGSLGMIGALLVAVVWLAASVLGLHDPIMPRHPSRLALAAVLLASCVSYVLFSLGLSVPASAAAQLSADRWLVLLFASAGLALAVTSSVHDRQSALGLVRALVLGASICAVVALVQAALHVDPGEWMRGLVPGFVDNGGNTSFQPRSGLWRVAGTTFHPIELAAVTAVVLPLALWRALFETSAGRVSRWLPVLLLVAANAATVSRTGVIALLVAVVIVVPFLPRLARRWAYVVAPVGIAMMFLVSPGLFGTLAGAFGAGDADPSITNRLDNYPRVAALVAERPWFGGGPGTYLPDNAIYLLDNEYLRSAVELGLVGCVAVGLYLVVPGVTALIAAQYAADPALRMLAAAVGAGSAVVAITAATFDLLAFPVISLLVPVLLGLAGSVWNAVRSGRSWSPVSPSGSDPSDPSSPGPASRFPSAAGRPPFRPLA